MKGTAMNAFGLKPARPPRPGRKERLKRFQHEARWTLREWLML